ncbi:extracellular solute-binding protein [Paenibacillus flagellatus]|uniref:ABC transporter substrate-binding protein n=1 Tax=Paenibacillus flagellatus TaxID=2211139 RepID=A0A2V5JUY5_9BACL|nr:extracellular solute-binding protein [Paenibacillus flagellatus]PYI50505.1 ABC transporter substrate-binding protein [Paenibacillus flagellatus]
MFKKTLSAMSIAVLAASVAACGGGGDTKTSGNTPDTKTPDNKQAEANKPKPQLRMLNQYIKDDPNQDPVAQYMKEKTGYDVKYDVLPVENADEKLNLLMNGKEPYDIMKLSKSQFEKLAAAGALEPLDDLIAKYGTNMKQVISQNSWNGVKLNGKTYAIPEAGSGIGVNSAFVVRQDWLDELNLKAPNNLDELYTLMKTLKDKKNVIPLTGGKDPIVQEIGTVFGMRTITSPWKESGGKLVHLVEDPATKEYLTYMKKLYTEGLIDSEWALNQSNKLIEKFTSGKAAMFKMNWANAQTVVEALAKTSPNGKMAILPFLQDKEGKRTAIGTGGIGWYIAVPKWAPNKEEAVKYMDLKLDKDIFKGIAIGQEGVHHTVKDGKYYPILPIFNEKWNNGSYFLTGVDEKNYPIYWQARVRKNEHVQKYYETYQENAKENLVSDALTFAPPLDAISKNGQKLNKLTEDTFIKFITGGEPLENYDKFLAQWKADGGNDMIKAANDWYASSKK